MLKIIKKVTVIHDHPNIIHYIIQIEVKSSLIGGDLFTRGECFRFAQVSTTLRSGRNDVGLEV